MKKRIYGILFLFVLLFLIVFACTQPAINTKIKMVEKESSGNTGRVSFSFGSQMSKSPVLRTTPNQDVQPASILISVKDISKTEIIMEKKKLELFNNNGEYLSENIILNTGEYYLTEFLVLDNLNNILYVTPQYDSPNAYLVEKPLKIKFEISGNNTTKVRPEVVSVTDSLIEYGYTAFTFDIKDNLLKNGNFLDGADNWFLLTNGTDGDPNNNPGAGTLTGIYEMLKAEINNGGDNFHSIGIGQLNIPLEKGHTYEIIFDAKSNQEREVKAITQLQADPWIQYSGKIFTINTEMTTYRYVFTMMHDTDENAGFQIHFGGSTIGNIYFDNVILRKISLIPAEYTPPTESNPSDFIRAKNNKLVVNENETEINLRGIAFGNNVWENVEVPLAHHNESDYADIAQMGANTVRFYLNYKTFEDDDNPYVYKKSGWDWLEQNIVWAKENNIYLIINMHVPQGGFQPEGDGLALWDNIENQNRLTSLWKEIASRYANEPVIAGLDLVNEPRVSQSADQWKNLAQRLVDEIRTVNQNHLIIVGRLLGVEGNGSTFDNPDYSQFLVNDPQNNVMYDFHFYYPYEYSLQYAPWTSFGDGGSYPNESKYYFPDDLTWLGGYFENETLLIGDGTPDWDYINGDMVQINNPEIACVWPVLYAEKTKLDPLSETGYAYFDEVIVNEYDENGIFVREIVSHDITNAGAWSMWTSSGNGIIDNTSDVQYGDYISISEIDGQASFSNRSLCFLPKTGYHYSVNGYMKGKNLPQNAIIRFQLEWEKSISGKPAHRFNKDYLKYKLKEFLDFGIENNVPMYVGEFGVYRDVYENEKGGLLWTEDVLSLLNQYNLNYTYHAYHEYNMGIYYNGVGLPDPEKANDELILLLSNYF